MNRRELLAAFFGTPFAALGCGSATSRLPMSGEIIGAAVQPGHRVRQGFRPQPDASAWRDVDVVIVGGGVAGLSAGRRLKQLGIHDFVVLELESELGGTSRGGTGDLVRYPWGAHYVPVPLAHQRDMIELLDEMQILEGRSESGDPIVAEQFLCRDPQDRLFLNGQWHEGLFPEDGASPSDLAQFAAFQNIVRKWVDWRDASGRRAFTLPVSECSTDAVVMALDRLTMSQWLDERGWNSPRLRWFVNYACRDDYGLKVEQTSAWAGLFYFAARMSPSNHESQPFITWPEGNARLIAHLAQCVGERTHTGWMVTEVTNASNEGASDEANRINVVAFREQASATEVRGWRARKVIMATQPFLTPFLVTGYREQNPQVGSEFQFGSWLVANLHLSKRPSTPQGQFPLSWDNVFYESPSLGYVTATHQRGLDYGPTVLTYYYPMCDDDPRVARERLLQLNWADCAEIALTDLERAHPEIRAATTRLDVMRWGHAMVRPIPGLHVSRVREHAQHAWRGIHFAHASLSGLPLFEEAFAQGNRAANEVQAELARLLT